MTKRQLVALLHLRVQHAGSQGVAAKSLGIAQPYLSEILSGSRNPGPKILAALRLREVVTYEKVK